jgi:hypothetical protein
MSLYLITNGWQGNGEEAVIVEADDMRTALNRAEAAFTAKANAVIERLKLVPEWQSKHHREQIDSYRSRDGWKITEIKLPFVFEYS